MTRYDILKKRKGAAYRTLCGFLAFTFLFSWILPPGYAQLIPQTILNLPAPGTMVAPSAAFTPALINGITIHPENPLEFDFIVGTGDEKLQGKAFEEESTKLIKYFLASLTVPEDEMWVNLSPYEKDRIIPTGFGTTEMGRDLLAQDYILKQLTASLMYPEKELGKKFWDNIYRKAREQYGTAEIPVNTFNKVWIVPEKAVVYEHGNSAFVVKSRLKVMLEEDYMAVSHQSSVISHQKKPEGQNLTTEDRRLTTQIIKEVILPAIEKEVNEGKSFANLRQIYHSAILAAWFKQNLRQTLLGQVYVDKTKTKGVDVEDKTVNEKIYAQYLEAFKKGVYNYIKEDYDPSTQEMIPRKYFSGGTNLKVGDLLETYKKGMSLTRPQQEIVGEYLAGLKEYNQGMVKANLVELSEEMSVAQAQEAIRQAAGGEQGKTKDASSPVARILPETRENPVTRKIVETFEKSHGEMAVSAQMFSRATGEAVEKIYKELDEEIYGPIYETLNEIADHAVRGEINPSVVRLRLSQYDQETPAVTDIGRPMRVLYLPMKGDPWQVGHLFVMLETIAKYKLDKVIVGIDNSDPIRKLGLSSLAIREAISRDMLKVLGDLFEYTPIAKEEEKLFEADGETMIFYLMSLNRNQPIDWYYSAGSDHRYWDIQKKHPVSGEEIILPDTAHKLSNYMKEGLDGFEEGGPHTLSLILSERKRQPVTEAELASLKEKSGLHQVGKIIQPMDTSSTRVRENGHFWTVPLSAYQYAKAFQMWGFDVEEVQRTQGDLAERLKTYLAEGLDGSLSKEESERRIKENVKQATGLGMDIFDSFLMKQLLKSELSAVDKEWLHGIRKLIFMRGEEIVKSASSSPIENIPRAVEALADRDLKGVRVLIRANLNVPMTGGYIQDTTRLKELDPVIKFLLARKADIILLGHNGRLEEGKDSRHSLRPLLEYFQLRFPRGPATLYEKSITAEGLQLKPEKLITNKYDEGSIHILQNVRFADKFENGKPGSPQREAFGRGLAELTKGDNGQKGILIVDAFGDIGSKGASIEDLPRHFTAMGGEVYAGPSMVKEFENFGQVLKQGIDVIIFGGVKSDKIEPLVRIVNHSLSPDGQIFLGSAPSAALAMGHPLLKNLMADNPGRVLTAVDYSNPQNTFDIGLQTRQLFLQKLDALRAGQTVLLNGTMGYVEEPSGQYKEGTKVIIEKLKELAGRGVRIIILGGDGGANAREYGLNKIENVSLITGGGVPLKILAGEELVGIKALQNAVSTAPVEEEMSLPVDDEDAGPATEDFESIAFLSPGRKVAVVLEGYWQTGRISRVSLQEIIERTGLNKEFVLAAINGINGNFNSPFAVEAAGLNKKLDNETLWIQLVPRRPLGEFRQPSQGLQPRASSPMVESRGQGPERNFARYERRTTKELGGINLDPALLDLQIRRDGNGVPLPLPQQPIGEMHIEGFIPVIINITPVTNLPMLLGIAEDELPKDSADTGSPTTPMILGLARED